MQGNVEQIILDSLKEIRETQIQQGKELTTLAEHGRATDKSLQDHHYSLYGNGRQGLTQDVQSLREAQQRRTKHFFVIYGAIIVMLLGIIGTYITALGSLKIPSSIQAVPMNKMSP